MAVKRYELSAAQWLKIASMLPGKASDPGRTGTDNRLFVDDFLRVLHSEAHWCGADNQIQAPTLITVSAVLAYPLSPCKL